MTFDVRNHIWNVFEIANKMSCSMQTACELFLTNVELGLDRYEGATDIDYAELKDVWNALDDNIKILEKRILHDQIAKYYLQFNEAWKENNKERFTFFAFVGKRPLHAPDKEKKEAAELLKKEIKKRKKKKII